MKVTIEVSKFIDGDEVCDKFRTAFKSRELTPLNIGGIELTAQYLNTFSINEESSGDVKIKFKMVTERSA